MRQRIYIVLIFLILTASCKELHHANDVVFIDKQHEMVINNLLTFFNENAYDNKQQTYFSEINNEGNIISDKVYNVALSRMIYGLSYASIIDESNLEKAEKALQFQLNNLTTSDTIGGHFISYIDTKNNETDSSHYLDIWQQAYGLCGMTEFYRNKPSEELLTKIHSFHDAFIHRFHDKVNGGFYGNYNTKTGVVLGNKSLQSLVYPITAYMENLWLADTENRDKYEPFLKENLAIAYEKVWNNKSGWVNVKFDDTWKTCEHTSSNEPCFTVAPGHNFQFASLLLRTQRWNFLTQAERDKYQQLGNEIIQTTLEKPIFPANDLTQGFFSKVNPVINEILDERKTWWQHCEALIALSLMEKEMEKEQSELEKFYLNTFTDITYQGEYFYVDKNNQPDTTALKGNIGKSTYHTIEMIRFLNEAK